MYAQVSSDVPFIFGIDLHSELLLVPRMRNPKEDVPCCFPSLSHHLRDH